MRSGPFKSSAKTETPEGGATETVARKTLKDSVVDISSILSQQAEEVKEHASPEPNKERKPDTDPDLDDDDDDFEEVDGNDSKKENSDSSPKFDKEEFDKFKDKTTKVLGDYVKDPKKVTKVMVKFGGMLRMLLYPFIYKLIIFETSDERKDCELTLKKITAAKKRNEVAELNDYEQELMAKWNDFIACKNKIMLSDEEVNLLTDILEDKVKDMPIAQWIEKYDWMFVLLYIESKRFVPVAGIRMKNNLMKDFNTD